MDLQRTSVPLDTPSNTFGDNNYFLSFFLLKKILIVISQKNKNKNRKVNVFYNIN